MSKEKQPGKKTIVVTKKSEPTPKKDRIRPTAARARSSEGLSRGMDLIYGWTQYKFFLIGIGLITLGLLLMLGGQMPSPDVWDDSIIYSFRRTVLAPGLMIAGLLVEVYAIFKD